MSIPCTWPQVLDFFGTPLVTRDGVLGKVRVGGVIECLGKSPRQSDALVELADGKQSGIAGELAG